MPFNAKEHDVLAHEEDGFDQNRDCQDFGAALT
jgi:hypothetical protein